MRNSLTPQKESEQEKTVLLTSLLSLSSCMSSVQVSVSRIWAAMAQTSIYDYELWYMMAHRLQKQGSQGQLVLQYQLNLAQKSSTSTDDFLDWKYCVTLGHFSLNFFPSSLFLFLFSLPLRNFVSCLTLKPHTPPHDKLYVTETSRDLE